MDGLDYTIALDPDGVRVTGKGKRRAEVELRWRDLLSGEAALSVALNASLVRQRTTTGPDIEQPPDRTGQATLEEAGGLASLASEHHPEASRAVPNWSSRPKGDRIPGTYRIAAVHSVDVIGDTP